MSRLQRYRKLRKLHHSRHDAWHFSYIPGFTWKAWK